MTRNQRVAKRGLLALAVASIAAGVVVAAFVACVPRDERLHAIGCTLILHREGRLDTRLPSDRVIRVHAFGHLSPFVVCIAALTAAALRSAAARVGQPPRSTDPTSARAVSRWIDDDRDPSV